VLQAPGLLVGGFSVSATLQIIRVVIRLNRFMLLKRHSASLRCQNHAVKYGVRNAGLNGTLLRSSRRLTGLSSLVTLSYTGIRGTAR
jgi:hypothetical protein